MILESPFQPHPATGGFGRVIAVTGAACTVALDRERDAVAGQRPEMGSVFAIDVGSTTVLAMVGSLGVAHVPGSGDEIWSAQIGLVGEIYREGREQRFRRGVTAYPSLGDRVRRAHSGELHLVFAGATASDIRVGTIVQDETIPALVAVDDLLGRHFAILGTTGTGKSCTTALVLRAILAENPGAHVVLLDPHNEYATAFKDWGEVVNQRNMQLPYWLLTFEELVEVLLGERDDCRQEIEILQDLIPVAKHRYGRGSNQAGLRRTAGELRYTVDTPVPYRMAELVAMIDERMGRLDNKNDLGPYRYLKTRIESITNDPRYAFMFGSLTVYDGMAQILGRLFRVPTNGRPITIVELTGLPADITNVVVSVICRLTFDFAVWSEGRVPVTLVCEEAHRYVPAEVDSGFEPCRRAIAKIAKEGRKYGASLCVVTQRPAEIDPTILSQCNTVFALRLSNERDQAIVRSAISESSGGLLEFLPSLGAREAIAFGDGVRMPMRLRFDVLQPECLPRSGSVRFSERWQAEETHEGFLDGLVERWRASAAGHGDASPSIAAFAEAVNVPYFGTDIQEGPVTPSVRLRARETGTERREFGAQRREPLIPGAPPGAGLPGAAGPRTFRDP